MSVSSNRPPSARPSSATGSSATGSSTTGSSATGSSATGSSPASAAAGSPAGTAPVATAPPVREPEKALAALKRYRVMAWVTGVMLLILSAEMLLKYAVGASDDVMRWIEWIPFAHGWIYVVYLVTVLDLWSKMRWGFGRLVVMVLGGVVPVMSFLVERRVHADAETRLSR